MELCCISQFFFFAVSIGITAGKRTNTVHDIRSQLQAHQCTQSLFHLFKKGMARVGFSPIMNSPSIYMTSLTNQEKSHEWKVAPRVTSSFGHQSVSVRGILKRCTRSESLVPRPSCSSHFCLNCFILANEIDVLFRNVCKQKPTPCSIPEELMPQIDRGGCLNYRRNLDPVRIITTD